MSSPAIDILKKPLTLPFSGKVAKNRVVKSAMSEKLATFSETNSNLRGKPTEALFRLYEVWGKGEIGIIMTGNIQIKKEHIESPGNFVLDSTVPSSYFQEYSELARLSHPGRQTSVQMQPNPVSSSDVQLAPAMNQTFAKPTPLTKEGIKDIINSFAHAAGVLHEAGFDGIQLHSAHGYLLLQFLSPRINKRTDEYGGSLANRSRIIFEIIAAIKQRVNDPSFSLSIKLNSQDFLDGGFSAEDSRDLSVLLEQAGIDFIELSGGTYESMSALEHKKESTRRREAYFVEFAELLRPRLTTTKVLVTGGFRTASVMADAIRAGILDLVGLARPLTAEPHLVKEILIGRTEKAKENKMILALSLAAASAQIGQIGSGLPITDYSDDANVTTFVAKLQGLQESQTAKVSA